MAEKSSKKPNNDLSTLLLKRLAESNLTSAHAKKLHLEVLSMAQVSNLGFSEKVSLSRPAIRIPYFTPEGEPTDFYRLRFLGNPTVGFSANVKKPARYAQKPDALNEVYMPPLLDCEWADILADPSIPLVITEGEFKAAAGCSRDIPVLGLGGVDVFRASKRGYPELLPVLEAAEWKGRPVTILWDSDVGTKPEALSAQRTLAHVLTVRGAHPKLTSLPPGPDGKKMGLDDYLLVKTPEDLQAIIAAAEPYEEAAALWEMNEDVVLVLHPPVVVVRKNGKLISTKDFTAVHYADRKFTVKVAKPAADGEPPTYKKVVKYTAKEWMEWPSRNTVDELTYSPGQFRITEDGKWNCWDGWGVNPEPGDVKPFLDLLNFIFRDQPVTKDWFLKWSAYPIQHPGAKLFQAVLIWGVNHGTGKTLLGYTLRDIYGTNAGTIGDAELHAPFNEWARNKQFVIGEEITGSDKRQDSNRLKALITQEKINVNAKYLPVITIPDCINYFFTSNESNALFLQDSDRRVMVHEVSGLPADHPQSDYGDPGLYKRYDAWRKAGGAAYLMHYLQHEVDLTGYNPRGPALRTSSKEEMIIDNKSDLARWCYELKLDPDRMLAEVGNPKAAAECEVFTPSQLFNVFNPDGNSHRGSLSGLARELKQAGFVKPGNGNPVQTRVGMQRFWAVRNVDRWRKARGVDVAAHWEEYWVDGKNKPKKY